MSRVSDRFVLAVLLGPGVFALSTAVIFVKLSELPVGIVAAIRLLGGALLLWPLMAIERRRRPDVTLGQLIWPTVVPGVLLGAHFISWFVGVRATTAANATLIVNLSPVIMPFALLALVGERVTRREMIGSALSIAGVIVLAAGSAKLTREGLIGDLVCLGSMVLAVLYLTLARRNGAARNGIGSYLVPLYLVACVATAGYAVIAGEVETVMDSTFNWPREALFLALMALLPTAFGHGLLNYAMTRVRGQIVALGGLGQIVWATLLAIPLLDEFPQLSFYPASALIAAGAVIAIYKPRKTKECKAPSSPQTVAS
ncbi:MAG: DMT family transporter [Planctomycetota bacterium]